MPFTNNPYRKTISNEQYIGFSGIVTSVHDVSSYIWNRKGRILGVTEQNLTACLPLAGDVSFIINFLRHFVVTGGPPLSLTQQWNSEAMNM